ncbi:MAG: hypothetical protein C6W56_14505 [Caldibacillus debilis]|nr:MAG: hypothetical protein C6W56_14505 [Caldibacillus debilis]
MRFHAKEAESRAMLRLSVRIFRRTGREARPTGGTAARQPSRREHGPANPPFLGERGPATEKYSRPLPIHLLQIGENFTMPAKTMAGISFFHGGNRVKWIRLNHL